MDKWISVEERLPESDVPVFAHFFDTAGRAKTVRAIYAAPKSVQQWSDDYEACEYDEVADCYWLQEGWYETNEFEEVHWKVERPITHWRPLPEPPK